MAKPFRPFGVTLPLAGSLPHSMSPPAARAGACRNCVPRWKPAAPVPKVRRERPFTIGLGVILSPPGRASGAVNSRRNPTHTVKTAGPTGGTGGVAEGCCVALTSYPYVTENASVDDGGDTPCPSYYQRQKSPPAFVRIGPT